MCDACYLGSAKEVVEALPSADVAPVVRCKDCIFGHKCFNVNNRMTTFCVDCRNPDGLHRLASFDEYCSAGIKYESKMDGEQDG